MPYPTKKQRLEGHPSAVVAANDDSVAGFDDDHPPARRSRRIAGRPNAHFDQLDDVLPNILAFLRLDDIMRSRRINKKVMEAVKKTIVPLSDFSVKNVEDYNAMRVMAEAMPNLQQLWINGFGWWSSSNKWSEGEDPDEDYAARTAGRTTYDIEIISNFRKLQILTINAPLNGRYPFLFHSFPLLQKLRIYQCYHLKWDLEMLAGLPLLKELEFDRNNCMTGNISSLRVLKDTLEKVYITYCDGVEGDFMDLADFPHLKVLDLQRTAVGGDIRDIGENDFSSLEYLALPKGVYGGNDYVLQSISDAHDLIRSLYLLKKRRPLLPILKEWRGELSADSPDWYESEITESFPFYIYFVKAGSRIGYRWGTVYEGPCEVNWLDPEPDRESSEYEKYFKEMCNIDSKVRLFKGFHQPPTEEEYNRRLDEHAAREESGSESEESDESDEGYSSDEW